jgi:protein TonB
VRLHLTIAGDAHRYFQALELRDRVLAGAIALSVVLHAIALSVHFKFPDSLRWKSANAPLDVVLVNARTKDKPTKADVLAQANLDRGGNVDQNRRAK